MQFSCSLGVGCCLLLSVFVNLGGVLLVSGNNRLCKEGDQLLSRGPNQLSMPSECMWKCTLQTYQWMVSRRDRVTVRLQTAVTGERGEHCWPLQLPCGKGELLQKVFVLLPLRDEAMDSAAPLELRTTSPAEPELLSPHSGQTALSQECGLRFDITTVFTATKNTLQFCVEPLLSGHPAPSSLTGALKCPPFLATVWIRRRPLEGNKMGN
ncbi:hypothetical protein AOXY_G33784 [Acipenser oxyrinchus oxyrinchus]|uniref:Interleukin-17 receptor C/E N-terminal domain-containing protein n=1 Tax=Acipenser oxyrinchus oxyrinchus TaxID=40147 RepID=A0AAD8CFN9_ACIOX|nr:hypothetical protein AOXY_G33784 [Acipenser oxyrinchus oxyrinchus]